jgi:hypothetical protein
MENYFNLRDLHFDGIGHLPLTKLTPLILDQWLTHLLQKVKPTTVNRLRRQLKAILHEAVVLDILPKNPLDRITPISERSEEQHPFTLEQVRAILHASEGERDEAIYTLGLFWDSAKQKYSGCAGRILISRLVVSMYAIHLNTSPMLALSSMG